MRRLRRSRAFAGLLLLGPLVALSLLEPLLPLRDAALTDLDHRLLPPFSGMSLLGTDHLGRDLLSRCLQAIRLSLSVAVVGTGAAAVVGGALGLMAGYHGRAVDVVIGRSMDLLLAFPYLLLAFAIVAVLGPGLWNATLAIAVVNVPFFARTVRGLTLSLRREEFVAAARVSGLSDAKILWSEILPNVAPTLTVAALAAVGWVLLETAGLSFLGLGAQPPTADLGGMLAQTRHLFATAPHAALIPGVVMALLALGLNLLADGVRDMLDPRLAAGRPLATGSPRRRHRVLSDASESTLLSVRDLRVELGGAEVVAGLSFDLEPRQRLAIVGESGSGKSVSCLAILGLLGSDALLAGSVRVHGRQCLGSPERQRELRGRVLGFVPQDPMNSLHPLFSVGEQMAEGSIEDGIAPSNARKQSSKLLRQVGVQDVEGKLDLLPHQLSGGERQRVAIAAALAQEPQIILADEPTTALDVGSQALVLDLLRTFCDKTGAALIFVTHDLAAAHELCSYVLVMKDGQLVEQGAIEGVFAAPARAYTRSLLSAVPRLVVAAE